MSEAVALDQADEFEGVTEAPEGEPAAEEYDYSPPEHWTEDERAAYERLAGLSDVPWDKIGLDPLDGRELQKLWKDRYSNWDKGFNKKMQEVADQRKQVQAYQENLQRESAAVQTLRQITTPYVGQWHSMGLLPDQVAAQAFHWATNFYQNPAGTLVEIAKQNGMVNDLLEALNTQEYVDPRFEQSQRQIAALEQQLAAQQQQQQQQQIAPFVQQIQQFQGAVNEDGSPKYPHSGRVWERMAILIRDGQAQTLEDAYNQALWTIPEERERLLAEQSKERAQKAREDAARAEQAGKRVKAKETGSSKPSRSLRDELSAALTEAGFQD